MDQKIIRTGIDYSEWYKENPKDYVYSHSELWYKENVKKRLFVNKVYISPFI